MSDYEGRHRKPSGYNSTNTSAGIFLLLVLLLLTAGGLRSSSPAHQPKALPETQAPMIVIPGMPTPPPTPAPSPTIGPVVPTPKPTKSPSPAPTTPRPTTPSPTPAASTSTPVSTPPATTAGTTMTVFLTGYSYWDNDPPGSAAISKPVIHQSAGGTGTYNDPVTLAVGYTSSGPDIAPGTRFYIPALHRYVIVEDTCGACHGGRGGHTWIDVYVDGAGTTAGKAEDCMDEFTGNVTAIKNPGPGMDVTQGPISSAKGCLL